MGISVPISAEQYNKLKAISDKLGLGLKKTMEYLVSYYWQKEMESSATKSKKAKSDIDESREESASVVQSNEAEPIVQSIEVKPIRQLLEELSKEYDLLPSNEITLDLVPQKKATNSTIMKEEDPLKAKSTIWPPQDMVQTCSCGSLKKPNAKYCYNCGNVL